jgi:hypothetical protein
VLRRHALLLPVIASIAVGACNRVTPPPPPPPPIATPTATTTTTVPTATATVPTPTTVAPTTVAPTTAPVPPVVAPLTPAVPGTTTPTPDPSTAPLSADAVVCAAALRCCESTSHAVRTAARREGFDPRDDPRRDPRYDPRYDPGYGDPREDPRIRRAVSRLVSGCRELRSPDEAHASRCARQIESIRQAFREAGATAPSSCHMPDLSGATPVPQ